LADLNKKLNEAISSVAGSVDSIEREHRQSPQRYDRNGLKIQDGPKFGPATRQVWESREDIEERLTSPDEDRLGEVIDGVVEEAELQAEQYGLTGEYIESLEQLDSFVHQATVAKKVAADHVVAANRNPHASIAAQSEAAFMQILNAAGTEPGIAESDTQELPGGLRLFDETDKARFYTNADGEVFSVPKDVPEPEWDVTLEGAYSDDWGEEDGD
jgi:hypothetical protein